MIGQGDLFCSSTRTCISTGTSGERRWSPRPYSRIGRPDRFHTLVRVTCDPRGFSIAPTPLPCMQQKNWSGRPIIAKGHPDRCFSLKNPTDPHFWKKHRVPGRQLQKKSGAVGEDYKKTSGPLL